MTYHPQANGIVERRIKEVMIHLRALVNENRVRDVCSQYLPFVQRILNYTIDGSIGTQPVRVIFGDVETSDIALDVPADWGGRNVEDYLIRLRGGQSIILRATQDYLKKNKRKRSSDSRKKGQDEAKFKVGQYVLLQYSSSRRINYRRSIVAQWKSWPSIVLILECMRKVTVCCFLRFQTS